MIMRSPVAITAAQALALAEARREELIELLSRLVAERSLSGEPGEAAQQVVLDRLATLPYSVERTADRPGEFSRHPEFMPPDPPGDGPFVNVVAYPVAAPSRATALFAHIDTHHVEPGWAGDPCQPRISEGRLFGLGAADGKGGVAAMLTAVDALASVQAPLPIVISTHGKGGGSRGSLPVFQRLRQAGQPISAVVYAHPAETGQGLQHVKHVVRGALDLRLEVRGWVGQPLEIGLRDSALWSEGGDALHACWEAIEKLRATVLRGREVNIGRLNAGTTIGSVPDAAVAEMRVLFDDGAPWSSLLDDIRAALAQHFKELPTKNGSYSFSLEPGVMRSNAASVGWDEPTTLALRRAIEEITGQAPASYRNHYNGDIRFPLRLLECPAFGIGSIGGNFYGPNEWVDLDDLVRLVAVLILFVSREGAVE
jgi:acetylornithine deacetylase